MFPCWDAHLHEHSRPEVLVSVPPVAGAARTAAGTQDTFIQPVLSRTKVGGEIYFHMTLSNWNLQCFTKVKTVLYQFLSVLHSLQVLLLPFLRLILLLQVGFNRLVLCVEVTHVLQTQLYSEGSSQHANVKIFFLLEQRVNFLKCICMIKENWRLLWTHSNLHLCLINLVHEKIEI